MENIEKWQARLHGAIISLVVFTLCVSIFLGTQTPSGRWAQMILNGILTLAFLGYSVLSIKLVLLNKNLRSILMSLMLLLMTVAMIYATYQLFITSAL